MKGRKNKSALISSSSRSVWPMHIQELHSSFLSLSLSLAISLLCILSFSLFLSCSFLLESTSPSPLVLVVDATGSYHGELYTYLRPPSANFQASFFNCTGAIIRPYTLLRLCVRVRAVLCVSSRERASDCVSRYTGVPCNEVTPILTPSTIEIIFIVLMPGETSSVTSIYEKSPDSLFDMRLIKYKTAKSVLNSFPL